jgi:type III pantothenate kinase
MKTLCIDVGNTSTHYGLVEGPTVGSTSHFPTHTFDNGPSAEFADRVRPLLKDIDGISFCSVVPAINDNLRTSLAEFALPIFHLTCETCTGLDLVYPKPTEIGQDRIANAIAAQAFHGTPAIVIDMGTAVTFDIISSAGYEGGIIAPGLAVMTKYLHEQTALLPELTTEDLLGVEGAIGKSTVHAMKLGVAVGFSGMIDALLARVITELQTRGESAPVVLSTGGSIANLTKDWAHKSHFVEDLTLMGLGVAFERTQ